MTESILAHDRLALFGYGVFETLLISEAGPLFIDSHWQRMKKGADLLGLKVDDKDEWVRQVQAYIVKDPSPSAFPYALRVTLSGGAPLSNLPSKLLFHKRVFSYTVAQYTLGIRLHLLPSCRNEQSPLVSIKSTNYLENILCKEDAKRKGADEGLWLNSKGSICEGTMSNIFFLKVGTLFTPSLRSGCLPGTRRKIILNLAQSLQIPASEGLYPLSDLLDADEVFMTNALMGIMPVREVDDSPFPVTPQGTITSEMRRLESAYNALINDDRVSL